MGTGSLVQSPLDRSLGLLTCCEGSSRRMACASSLSHVPYINLYPARLPMDSVDFNLEKSDDCHCMVFPVCQTYSIQDRSCETRFRH